MNELSFDLMELRILLIHFMFLFFIFRLAFSEEEPMVGLEAMASWLQQRRRRMFLLGAFSAAMVPNSSRCLGHLGPVVVAAAAVAGFVVPPIADFDHQLC